MFSLHAFLSFSTPTITFWKKLRNSAPLGGCGHEWCEKSLALKTRAHGCCAFTLKPRGQHSPHSSRKIILCVPRSRRWPQCSAAHNHCTRIHSTKRYLCRRSRRRESRCEPSKSSHSNPECLTPSILWRDRILSSHLRTKLRSERPTILTKSTHWAECSKPLTEDSCSKRFRMPHMN